MIPIPTTLLSPPQYNPVASQEIPYDQLIKEVKVWPGLQMSIHHLLAPNWEKVALPYSLS